MKILLVFFFVFSFTFSNSQDFTIEKFSQIPLVQNLDSLEKICINQNLSDTKKNLYNLLVLENSRLMYNSYKTGENLSLIDSLAIILKNKTGLLFVKYSKAKLQSIDGYNKDKTLAQLNEIVNECKKNNDTSLLIKCYFTIFNMNILEPGKSNTTESNLQHQLNEIIQIANINPNTLNKLYAAFSRLDYFIYKKNTFEANLLTDSLVSFAKQSTYYNYFLANIYIDKSLNYYYASKYDSAIYILQKCLSLPNQSQSINLAYCYFNLGFNYIDLKKLDSAKLYLLKSINTINLICPNNKRLLYQAYLNLAETYSLAKKHDSAWSIRNHADSIQSLMFELENSKQFLDLQTKYKTKEKDFENSILKSKNKMLYVFILIGILFTSIIIYLFFKNMKKNKELVSANSFNEKVISVISHDLRSPLMVLKDLNSLYSYLIKKNDTNDIIELANSIDKTSNNILNVLNNLIAWSISKNNPIKKIKYKNEDLNLIVNNSISLYKNLFETKNIQIKIENKDSEVFLPVNKNVVELFIRNWVDNIIKYSTPTLISIQIFKNQIQIIDDGFIENETIKTIKNQLKNSKDLSVVNNSGLGLSLMSYFAKKEMYSLEINRMKNNTFFIIMFNKPQN